jgi:hypothetical protein
MINRAWKSEGAYWPPSAHLHKIHCSTSLQTGGTGVRVARRGDVYSLSQETQSAWADVEPSASVRTQLITGFR